MRSVTAVTEYGDAIYVGPCAALRELAEIRDCAPGDTFATSPQRRARPSSPSARGPGRRVRDGVFTTAAPAGEPTVAVRVRARRPERVRGGPQRRRRARPAASRSNPVERIATDAQFALLRRAMFAGATIVMALIGFSLLLTALEQLRERRRLLAVLVAFGTRRSTLSWSLLWQSAVPVGLGLVVAVATGIGLGAILLAVIDTGIRVAWLDVFAMVAAGAVVVLLVTAASLPVLFRTMRPEGLRTE